MQLYYSPMACSLASRIALHEIEAEATFTSVNRVSKTLPDGSDYREVHSLGLVPALRLDDERLLTENPAVLRYIAGLRPERGIAPADPRLDQWLSFVGAELHRAIFTFLFRPGTPDEVRAHALEASEVPLRYLDAHLTDREYLLDTFTVADAYLWVVLNWCVATPVPLEQYPALVAYRRRHAKRPSIARAVEEELPEYRALAAS